MDPLTEFRSIARAATNVLSKTHNAPDLVPFGARLVELVNRHPELRGEFENAFVAALDQREDFDLWLLQFCMHALQWPELEEQFINLSRQAIPHDNWNKIQPLQHILDAFEQDWEDAKDLYAEYFFKKSQHE